MNISFTILSKTEWIREFFILFNSKTSQKLLYRERNFRFYHWTGRLYKFCPKLCSLFKKNLKRNFEICLNKTIIKYKFTIFFIWNNLFYRSFVIFYEILILINTFDTEHTLQMQPYNDNIWHRVVIWSYTFFLNFVKPFRTHWQCAAQSKHRRRDSQC